MARGWKSAAIAYINFALVVFVIVIIVISFRGVGTGLVVAVLDECGVLEVDHFARSDGLFRRHSG